MRSNTSILNRLAPLSLAVALLVLPVLPAAATGHNNPTDGPVNLVATGLETRPEAPRADHSTQVELRLSNQANATAENVSILLMLDHARVIFHDELPAVQPGTVHVQWTTWENATAGNHTLTLIVDPEDRIEETDEGDNRLDLDVHVLEPFQPAPEPGPDPQPTPARPDLDLSNLTWSPQDPHRGDEMTFQATVGNLGDAPSQATTVRVTLEDGTEIGEVELPALDPGEHTAVQSPGWAAQAGEHNVTATADPAGELAEHAEDNNARTRTVDVHPCQRGLQGMPCELGLLR